MSNLSDPQQLAEFPGVQGFHIELAAPLLVLKAARGILACGYINVATLNKLREAGAIVSGVSCYQDMLNAKLVAVSDEAIKLGLSTQLTGWEALTILNASAE